MNVPQILGIAIVLLCGAAWLRGRYLVKKTFDPIEREFWLNSFRSIYIPRMTTPNGLAQAGDCLRFMRMKAREFKISEAELGTTFHELLGHAVMRQREIIDAGISAGDPIALVEDARREYENLNAEWLLANNINPAMCQRFDIPSRLATSS